MPVKFSCTSAGLYQQEKILAASCALMDSDFTQNLSAIGVQAPEVGHGSRGKKPAQEKAETEDVEIGSNGKGIAGWSDAALPPRFSSLQQLLRLLTLVSKLQVQSYSTF